MTAFFDTTSKMGLCQDTDFLVGSNTTKYPLADKARNGTEWLKKAGVWVWQSASDWEFDDSNQGTLPVATADLVDNQQDITLPTTIFKLDRLEILDSEGNYQLVTPIDKSQINMSSLPEFLETPGLPRFYDLVGNSVIFYPKVSASSVTLSAGVRIYIARDVVGFTATTTSREPGFSEYFHRIISVGMAHDYAASKGMRDKTSLMKKMLYGDPNVPGDLGLKGELQQAYGSAHRDFKERMRIQEEGSGI